MRIILTPFLFLLVTQVNAATYSWVGGKYANFSDPSSWSSFDQKHHTVPGPGDDIVFSNNRDVRIVLDRDIELRNITVEKSAHVVFFVQRPVTITVTGSLNLKTRTYFKGKVGFNFETRSSSSSIKNSGTQYTGDIVFDGKHPLTVLDPLQTSGNIILRNQEIFAK
ncbi:MAG TPA: hypothetical protein VD905_12880, partial [Flavobacteriales bacterium]|nr:hypothetical protein [Flavobacteriales bacterium]